MIKKKLSILIFIWSALLFFINLQYNLSDELANIIFWLSILLMIGIIIYQIFFLKNNTFVLFEIFIIYLFLHLTLQVGYPGLRGSDSYFDYNFFKAILNDHHFVIGENLDSGWPMIHLLSSGISEVTKIDPLLIAKYLPSFISSLIVLPLYLLVYNIYKTKKIALFSCLLFGTIPQFISMESLFVREAFTITVFILFFCILYISKQKNEPRLILLCVILIPAIVLGHHFTSFMLIIFLFIYILISKELYVAVLLIWEGLSGAKVKKRIVPYIYKKYESNKKRIQIVFLILLISVLSYWAFFTPYVLDIFSDVFYESVGVTEFGSYSELKHLSLPQATLGGSIIYYSFFFFHILFGSIFLVNILINLIKKSDAKIEDYSFALYFIFLLFIGALGLFYLGSVIYADRFLPFAWIIGIIPLTGLLLSLKKDVYKKILIIVLISFVVFNLYNIDPVYYTGETYKEPDVAGDIEYSIAITMKFPLSYHNVSESSLKEYYGYIGVIGAIYDIQGITQRRVGQEIMNISDFYNIPKIVIIEKEYIQANLENLKRISYDIYLNYLKIISYKDNKNVNMICDLGNVYVLKGAV